MKGKFNKLLASGLTVLLLSSATSALAQSDEAQDAIEYRQSALQLIRANFGVMADMVRGDVEFDAAVFAQKSKNLSHLAHIPWDGFTGAGANTSEGTDALPEIWEDWSDFEQKAQALVDASAELALAAEDDNMGQIRAKFMATVQTCRECHNNYRAD
ncbi:MULTISPECIES: cytochrome c [Gammaproteobacteria]|uniref:c-type cytochrome n=1 Tax=Gammaproteobacteria TaxID=1236 RepID=UPI000DCF65EB|nr:MULTISPECIES: cytochrome c [Gammaproteobacteria]RTE87543.1 cytochrome c [Aliidiomarina sp. B3213]TCZ92672.1 cytochrome c [Lysobacter sp. N42]